MDSSYFFFFQAEDGIRDVAVTGVQTCALPIFARLTPALLGELVNLVGHDREAAAVHARARRLDRGVQGQQVGLIRDEADGLRELLDLLGDVAQPVHFARALLGGGAEVGEAAHGSLSRLADLSVVFSISAPAARVSSPAA